MKMKSTKRGAGTFQVEVSGISPHGVWLYLWDREVFLSFEAFPWFREATVAAVMDVKRPHPHHLHWPQLDVDLSIESIDHPDRYPLISRERPMGYDPHRRAASGGAPAKARTRRTRKGDDR
ncbi:MAG TPA: DUF2442 domain-containing protein [Candidatus Eisenbacteria bacterium]|nr:DUF2442 domain-containing protein [Candidatus Eisenbacteria bacterium]